MATIDDFGRAGQPLSGPSLSDWAEAVRDAVKATAKDVEQLRDGVPPITSVDTDALQAAAVTPAKMSFSVTAYGAVGDGTTDDTTAIQACLNAAPAGGHVWFPPAPGAGYRTTATVQIPATVSVTMDAPVIYAGTSNVPVITVGAPGSTALNREYRLSATRTTQSDWTSEDNVAIRLINLSTCRIDIVQAMKSTIGVQCIGNAGGFQENITRLGLINHNRIGVDLNNASGGWCNENLFVAGNFGVSSGVNSTVTRVGVRSTSATTYRNNNNVFLKPAFELNAPNVASKGTVTFTDTGDLVTISAAHRCAVNDAVVFGTITGTTGITAGTKYYVKTVPSPTTMTLSATAGGPTLALTGDGTAASVKGEAICFLIEHATEFRARDVRAENVTSPTARVLNTSRDCEIRTGFGSATVDDQSTLPSSFAFSGSNQARELPSRTLFDSGPMHRTGLQIAASSINIPRVHFGWLSGGASALSSSPGTITPDYIELPFGRGLGVFVDTRAAKTFIMRTDVDSGNGGRFVVALFDAAGVQLGDTAVARTDAAYGELSWTTGYGGGWSTMTDTQAASAAIMIRVPPEAAYARLLVTSGTAVLRIRSLRVETLAWATAPAVWAGYEEVVPGVNIATAAPIAGTHAHGRIVYNSAPTAGAPHGWVCTVAGTPGTWVPLPPPGAFTSTTTALAGVANAINTTDKYTGKRVWNTTTKKSVTANGPLASDVWTDESGATAHTPS